MKKVTGALVFGGLFAALVVLLGRYDVAPIGPEDTEVGFSHLNNMVHELTGVNMLWYDITDYIGYAAIAVCALFALAGFVQMVKRRSLLKVDREILSLGALFVVVIGLYVFFEKFIINYRPVIMPDAVEPEASFPSSHTMLVMTVFIAVMIISDKYLKGVAGVLVRILCFLTVIVTIGGRLWCGVHWFTDIIGGVLLSAALLFLFRAAVSAGGGAAPDSSQSAGSSHYKPKH